LRAIRCPPFLGHQYSLTGGPVFGVHYSFWRSSKSSSVGEQLAEAMRKIGELKPGEMLITLKNNGFIDGDGI